MIMLPTESVLPRLNRLRQQGQGKWAACCPAHDDSSPSLVLKEAADGRLLVHCFAGCDAKSVMGSIGLSLADLYPVNPSYPPPQAVNSRQLQQVRSRALDDRILLQVAQAALATGEKLSSSDEAAIEGALLRWDHGYEC